MPSHSPAPAGTALLTRGRPLWLAAAGGAWRRRKAGRAVQAGQGGGTGQARPRPDLLSQGSHRAPQLAQLPRLRLGQLGRSRRGLLSRICRSNRQVGALARRRCLGPRRLLLPAPPCARRPLAPHGRQASLCWAALARPARRRVHAGGTAQPREARRPRTPHGSERSAPHTPRPPPRTCPAPPPPPLRPRGRRARAPPPPAPPPAAPAVPGAASESPRCSAPSPSAASAERRGAGGEARAC